MYNYLKHFKPKSIVDLIDSDENTKNFHCFFIHGEPLKKMNMKQKRIP